MKVVTEYNDRGPDPDMIAEELDDRYILALFEKQRKITRVQKSITRTTTPEEFEIYLRDNSLDYTHRCRGNIFFKEALKRKNDTLARYILRIGGNLIIQYLSHQSDRPSFTHFLKKVVDAELLYEIGFDLNTLYLDNDSRDSKKEPFYTTPLTAALEQNNDKVATFLIKNGAVFIQPSLETDRGKRIQESAIRVFNTTPARRTAAFLSSVFLVEKPLKKEDDTWGSEPIKKRDPKTKVVTHLQNHPLCPDVIKLIYEMSDLKVAKMEERSIPEAELNDQVNQEYERLGGGREAVHVLYPRETHTYSFE